MKKYLFIITIVNILTSCSDYLDLVPDNIATLDHAFSNKKTAEAFLYTVYSAIPAPSNVGNPSLTSGDEIWLPETERWRSSTRIARGTQSSSFTHYNRWSGEDSFYIAIRNANIFLEKINDVLELNDYEKTTFIAEANFLKAYYHFYLLKMYGPIVINDKAISVTTSSDGVKVVRNSIDDSFEYVITLLDKVIEDLPLTFQSGIDDLGRITKPIAAAIKAEVLITYASPLFNGNTVYSQMLDAEGNNLFPQTVDPSKWERAAIAAKEAIDLCHEAGFKLYDDYTNPFDQSPQTLLKATLRGRVTEKWNSEIVWGHGANTFNIQREAIPNLYPLTTNPVNSRHAPTLRIAEMYYSKNGVPIEEDNTYSYGARYNVKESTEEIDKHYIEQGQQTAILNFDREPRFYADLAFDRSVWFGNGKELDTDPWYIHSRHGEFASIRERSQYSVTGYWAKKLVNLKSSIRDGRSFISSRYAFPIIRLSSLYLYYAEALNETKGTPDIEVYKYINKVRERAGFKNGVVNDWRRYSSNPDKPATQDGMRKIIRRERMIEMAFEGPRFWDLRRWKLANIYMNRPIRGWNVLESEIHNYYTISLVHSVQFSEKDYFWPIPERDIIRNPNLIQNLGW